MNPFRCDAFTLIELLVVITIIVVLLALLTPALDRAITQAELAVCASQLRTVASGVTSYAAANRRAYPTRSFGDQDQPTYIGATRDVTDQRPLWDGYFPVSAMQDPLTVAIELEDTPDYVYIFGSYASWYSWQFASHAASRRMGDRFSFTDSAAAPARTHRFDLLAGDYDEYNQDYDAMVSNHNDRSGTMQEQVFENEGVGGTFFGALSLSRYQRIAAPRDLLELNFAWQDGSVNRMPAVEPDDERTVAVPATRAVSSSWPVWYHRLPTVR